MWSSLLLLSLKKEGPSLTSNAESKNCFLSGLLSHNRNPISKSSFNCYRFLNLLFPAILRKPSSKKSAVFFPITRGLVMESSGQREQHISIQTVSPLGRQNWFLWRKKDVKLNLNLRVTPSR